MLTKFSFTTISAAAILVFTMATAQADDLRNVKRGEPIPAFKLPTIDGSLADSDAMKGSAVVVVCLSAEQRRSEMAMMDSSAAVKELASPDVKLIHVTADVVQRSYFEKFRRDRDITATLAFDPERVVYGKLGLIVFPTTVIIGKDGKVAEVISLHNPDYKNTLTAYLQHVLGLITDEQLKARLAEHVSDDATPKSLASAHRALARSMRQKGQLEPAKAELNKAHEQDPANDEVVLDIADLDLAMSNYSEAETMIAAVLARQPDHRRAKQLKGISLFHRGMLDDARAALEEALSLNPSPEVAHYYLGQISEQQGKTDEALRHYKEALRRVLHEGNQADAGK
ncbi:MAG TPA: tetratricopeptide repeat protein [Phycisphaerales bacterium]|nr:tetratricopeptide repeat protein [Phycisphaerales bacterium]